MGGGQGAWGFSALYFWNQEVSKKKKRGVGGFKRVRIQKSLEIRVKKSVLYCANTITSQGRGKKNNEEG